MSSINPNNIDGQYPVAGQDNDSQGFRDNFTNIKNNLNFAKTEIEDLQSKVLLKQPLQGFTLSNEMDGAALSGVKCLRFRETTFDIIETSGAIVINWENGQFQYLEIDGNVTSLDIEGWPDAGDHAKLRLEVKVTGATRTISLASAGHVYFGLTDLQGYTTGTTVSLAVGTYLFEFTTYDAGSEIHVVDLLRNKVNNDNVFVNTATGKIGYSTGATVTQLTSKSANVTLNRTSGNIIMNNASLSAAANVTFSLNNSTISSSDIVLVNIQSGATGGTYQLQVEQVATGFANINVRNFSGTNRSEALVLNFVVFKGANS